MRGAGFFAELQRDGMTIEKMGGLGGAVGSVVRGGGGTGGGTSDGGGGCVSGAGGWAVVGVG